MLLEEASLESSDITWDFVRTEKGMQFHTTEESSIGREQSKLVYFVYQIC